MIGDYKQLRDPAQPPILLTSGIGKLLLAVCPWRAQKLGQETGGEYSPQSYFDVCVTEAGQRSVFFRYSKKSE